MHHEILKYEELSSTQDKAKELLETISDGTVVVANRQLKGRGKPGNSWFSPEGGLYFTVVLKTKEDVSDILLVTRLVADVVCLQLKNYGIDPYVKLPNDVYVKDKKISGILVEKTKNFLLIGIGINLNIENFENVNGTSVFLLKKDKIDIDLFLNEFLGIFDERYLKFIHNRI